MPTYKIIAFGDDVRVSKRLGRGAAAAATTAPVMGEILLDMFKVEKAIFASQGRRGGSSWKKLQPDTIRRKVGTQILINNGDLFRSVTVPGAKYQDVELTNTTVSLGSRHPGAKSHQYGRESQGIPARPFIRFTPADAERWITMIKEHLMRAVARD